MGGLLGTSKDNAKTKLDKRIELCETQATKVKDATRKFTDANATTWTTSDRNALNSAIKSLNATYKGLVSDLDINNGPTTISEISSSDWVAKGDTKSGQTTAETTSENKSGPANEIYSQADNISNACQGMKNENGYKNYTETKSNAGRLIADGIGAAVLGTAGGITTAQIMKANNRSDFTAAQQEWMDEIGSKIHCYVGGQLVGDFGDIVSVDISEE